MRLENDEGLPWTTATGIGWTVLIVAVTSGVAWLALSIYLSLWIYRKGRSPLPLFGFLSIALASALDLGLDGIHRAPHVRDAISWWVSTVWIASNFSLRCEIRRYYKEKEGWEPQFGLFFTFLFGSIYMNYCLNRFDFTPERPDPAISLNLGSPTKPTNLRK